MDWQINERSAMLNYMCVAKLRVGVTGALVDWKNKEMGAIFNHIKYHSFMHRPYGSHIGLAMQRNSCHIESCKRFYSSFGSQFTSAWYMEKEKMGNSRKR